ncbi:4412_t:CDS:1, partial [Gigaspora rosea]
GLEKDYKIEIKWSIDINKGLVKKESVKISCLIYVYNTTFIGDLKQNLETITKVANEYYEINNIKPNSTKSELLVMHKKNKKEDLAIELKAAEK